jgi:hypothetical protein
MTLAEHGSPRANGHGGLFSKIPWPNGEMFENLARSPRTNLPLKNGKRIELSTDRVRAKPALSPTVSMNIGVTAIGLGMWGTLFPRHVARTLGIKAPTPVVQTLFGLRELWTGYTLAGDPTKSGMLWTRLAGDIFDIAVLRSLDRPSNPQRGTARAALGFVIAVTALDAITAVRMSAVRRNCA